MNCRHCKAPLTNVFLDLGFAPPSNAYLAAEELKAPEKHYPLKLFVCDRCWLVQTEDYARADELFSHDYAYFSSTSTGWLDHADGYLLKNFVAAGIPCLGIEPTASTAAAAEKLGIPVLREFFCEALGKRLASEGRQADLIVGNNVYAHVPDINDFTSGLKAALKRNGTITLEFPHLLRLIQHTQFDTVYHEHFSYLSLYTVSRIFEQAGLRIFEVEELPTHGGSLRVFGCHADDGRLTGSNVLALSGEEERRGLRTLETYAAFQQRADHVKDDLVTFLIEQKRSEKKVVAYGAAAKGNTLLNYGGIRPDLLPCVCDGSASKQGKFMPGSHIPILPPSALKDLRPDLVLILPWNIADEVRQQSDFIRDWGGKFVVAVPSLTVLN
ncbi:MAG: class I SAM-dependent methyltransferase [Proteobacteria bacterium]|nr:class I SAM-dependent methyltransferase [Pseudomonadota bacterium]